MLVKDQIVVLDYETVELQPDGSKQASTEFYRKEFRVDSVAISWRDQQEIKSKFVQGEDAARELLTGLQHVRLVCHNAQFEIGVSRCRFPDLKLQWYADTMRMVQVFDNSGDPSAFEIELIAATDDDSEDDAKKVFTSGLGLAKAAHRILGADDHKHEAHEWLRNNGVKKGKEGANLHLLPLDILATYNIADTETTLKLYEHLETNFLEIDYNYRKDHTFYLASVSDLVDAQIRGIRVNVPQLTEYVAEIKQEVAGISAQFLEANAEPIKLVEQDRLVAAIAKRKTEKGQIKYQTRLTADPALYAKDVAFNPGSNKQLQALFVDKLKIKPFFFTKKESPSFKSAHLHQWGPTGLLLAKRRKRLLVQKQAEALIDKAAYDGRYHVQLRACGTVTGRFAGSGGVNVQALARRDEKLMTALLPEPGSVFISSDMGSGEPSIITQLTKDKNYRYFCFDGIGKKPFYDGPTLMLDDIYLAYASRCSMFKDQIRTAFNTGSFSGMSLADAWLKDPEIVKDHKDIKSIRKNAKWMVLGFGYGLGANELYNKALEAGLKVTRKDCKDAFLAYWDLFSGIKSFAKRLEQHVEQHGWFENPFGYRFKPVETRKSFNGMVQSSVSGLFHWYGILMKEINPFAMYVTTIHDENLYQAPVGGVDDFKAGLKRLTDHINQELKWDIDLRFGCVSGDNLFEAK